MFKHCSDVDNKVVDALSKKLCTLQAFSAKVLALSVIQEYPTCKKFNEIYIF